MHTLHICTIHPPDDDSIFTKTNYELLSNLIGDKVILKKNYVTCWAPFEKGTGNDGIQIGYRNRYLNKVKQGEFILILDTDDQLCGFIKFIPELMDLMMINQKQTAMLGHIAHNFIDGYIFFQPRLLYKLNTLEYKNAHNEMYNKQGVNIIHKDYQEVIRCPSIFLSHHTEPKNVNIAPVKQNVEIPLKV